MRIYRIKTDLDRLKIDPSLLLIENNIEFIIKQESFAPSDNRNMSNASESVFSPSAPAFQGRGGNEQLLNLLAQQEPRAADTGMYILYFLIL